MTETTQAAEPMKCPVTGLPYVRKITFEDDPPTAGILPPVHVPSRVLFDGVCVTPEWDGEKWTDGILIAKAAEVALGPAKGTTVTLWVDVDDCTPPFLTPKEDQYAAPATIAGLPFMTPPSSWGADEPEVEPFEVPCSHEDGTQHTLVYGAEQPWGYPLCASWKDDDRTWVRCVVYAAEVEVR